MPLNNMNYQITMVNELNNQASGNSGQSESTKENAELRERMKILTNEVMNQLQRRQKLQLKNKVLCKLILISNL